MWLNTDRTGDETVANHYMYNWSHSMHCRGREGAGMICGRNVLILQAAWSPLKWCPQLINLDKWIKSLLAASQRLSVIILLDHNINVNNWKKPSCSRIIHYTLWTNFENYCLQVSEKKWFQQFSEKALRFLLA